MEVMFDKCADAIEYTNSSKTYGCFRSNSIIVNEDIHIHDCFEIFFCTRGYGNVFVDEKVYELNAGDVFVINQYEAHKVSPNIDSEFERYAFQIHPSFLYYYSTPESDLAYCFNMRTQTISHKITLNTTSKEKLMKLFEKLNTVHDWGDDILKTTTVLEIVTFVNDKFLKQNKYYSYRSSLENQTITIAIDYINKNFHMPLSLEIVSKKSFVSVNELCRLFKKHLGTTVSKYIASKRISEAKKMLKNGLSVTQTAEKCGFSDYTTFIRTFSRITGIAPGKYKKSN